jgi:hypothetical protein
MAQDGRTYRVTFAKYNYFGGVTEYATVPGGITLETGTPGLQSAWDTVLPQRLTVSIFVHTAISDLYAISVEEWRVRLELEGSPNTLLWYGYLQPAITRQPLFRSGVAEFVAVGFMVTTVNTTWESLTRDDLAKTLRTAMVSAVAEPPLGEGLALLTRYYPYLAGATMTGEPFERLQADGRVWQGKTNADVVRGVASSFGCEVFHSGNYTWVVQRGALRDLVAANIGAPSTVVPARALPWSGIYLSTSLAVSDMVVNLDALNVQFEYDIAPVLPEARHTAAYRWTPAVGRVFTNETFALPQFGDPDDSENPRHWVIDPAVTGRPRYTWTVGAVTGIYRARRVFVDDDIITGFGGSPVWGLQVAKEDPLAALGPAARQRTGFRMPGGEENLLGARIVGRMTVELDESVAAAVYVSVTDGTNTWYLTSNEMTVTGTLPRGEAVVLGVVAADSVGTWGASPVVGTLIIPAGTALSVGSVSVTTTKDYRVGDLTIEVRASGAGSTSAFIYWQWVKSDVRIPVGIALESVTATGDSIPSKTEIRAPLIDPQGRPVEGIAEMEVWQNETPEPDTSSANAGRYTIYTDLSLILTKGTGDARGIEVLTLTGKSGITEELPDAVLGDGPRFDSISGLTDRITGQSTLQQGTVGTPQAAGWKRGTYASTSENSTGHTLEEVRARDASRQMADPLDMVYITAVLRSGDPLILPHHVVIAEGVARWRTYYRWDVTQARVELHAVALNESSAVSTAKRTLL